MFGKQGNVSQRLNFDIDTYLNRIIHPSFLHRLPPFIAHFLGYRRAPRRKQGNILDIAWATLGAFSGVLLIEGFFIWSPMLQSYSGVTIIGSFGAAAILEYNTIESPFAQPRNSILGHVLAAVVGVSITKLFGLSNNFEDLRWIAGGISCSIACAVMELTKTTHPPAGATALLAAVDPNITQLGWFLLPVVLASSLLMLFSALLINNIHRQFPMYWWTPTDLSQPKDSIKMKAASTVSESRLGEIMTCENACEDRQRRIVIASDYITCPHWIYLADEEIGVLEILRERLKEGLPGSVRENLTGHRRRYSHP